MILRRCAVWLVLVGSPARATVYIDKQLTTHCGALLLIRDRSPPAQFVDHLRRLPSKSLNSDDARYADVEVLDLPGWNDADRLGRSDQRLRQLARDLDHAPSIPSVSFVTRGSGVATFLAHLSLATETLDREVQAQADQLTLNPRRSLIEIAAAAAVLVGGGQLAQLVPAPLVALTETAAIVGAGYVVRGVAERAWSIWFPAEQLDLRRVRLDSHLRMINDRTPHHGRAHIGMSSQVSTEILNVLLRARDWTELKGPTWARLIADHIPRPDDVGARLLVDHVSFTDPESQEAVLLSAVRVIRERPCAKRSPPRNSFIRRDPTFSPAY